MSPAIGKSSKIRHIVRIKQMLRRWRKKAAQSSSASSQPYDRIREAGGGPGVPSDVPVGHVAICVVPSCRRFVVRATHLNHPIFKNLLVQAEEEYGFASYPGPLAIPCDDSLFEEIVRVVSAGSARFANLEDLQIRCRLTEAAEHHPLHGCFAAGKTVC